MHVMKICIIKLYLSKLTRRTYNRERSRRIYSCIS